MASSWGWPQLLQDVDLVGQLAARGLSREAACAFLDTSPPLLLEVRAVLRSGTLQSGLGLSSAGCPTSLLAPHVPAGVRGSAL